MRSSRPRGRIGAQQGVGEVSHTTSEYVLEANVKGGVGVRGEDGPRLSHNVSGTTVLVADGISNLQAPLGSAHPSKPTQFNIRKCSPACHRPCIHRWWP